MTNVAAFKEEPNMPPEDQLRAWVLVYYEEDRKIDPEKFWKETGKDDFNRYKGLSKADNAVKRLAAELTAGIEKPEDKVAAIELYCRTKIRNITSSAFHVSAEERKSLKPNHSPGDTLKQMAGRGLDVNLLFVALVNAAGLEARMARIPDRSDTFFDMRLPTTYFLRSLSAAVRIGEKWSFFDPATPYLEPGMLRWQEESQQALVSDPKEGFFVATQYSPPERSKRQRSGKFTLTDDGTLEGTVQYTYTGHSARAQKDQYDDMTPAQQEEDWKGGIHNRFSNGEISDFSVQNANDPVKPLVIRHKIISSRLCHPDGEANSSPAGLFPAQYRAAFQPDRAEVGDLLPVRLGRRGRHHHRPAGRLGIGQPGGAHQFQNRQRGRVQGIRTQNSGWAEAHLQTEFRLGSECSDSDARQCVQGGERGL